MSNRFLSLSRPVLLGAFVLLAGGLTVLAQPPAAEPAKKEAPAAGAMTYQAELVETRPDAKRVTFRVRQGGSVRVFNMTLADNAKVETNGQAVGLGSMAAGSNVTIMTENKSGLEQIVMIGTGGPGMAAKGMNMAGGKMPGGKTAPMDGPATSGKMSLAFPTGDPATSVLLIETNAPDEVRVGEAYDYQIKVTNISKLVTLDTIEINQSATPKLGLMASGQPANPGDGPIMPGEGQDGADLTWTIPMLNPGDFKMLTAQAVPHDQGVVSSCFSANYKTALCVRLKAVQPAIALAKVAPEAVRLCEAFAFKYTVKNTGTASAKGITVTDTLPEGLVTGDNKKVVTFTLPELAAGESKEFSSPIVAAGRGAFTSKATAKTEGGLNVESRATTTAVREAALEVTLVSPETAFVQESMTFVATVKNVGDAPAPGSTLDVQLDQANATYAKSTPVEGVPAAEGQATPDKAGNLSYKLGTINPGESRKVSITLTGTKAGAVNALAVGKFVCDRAKDDAALAMAKAAAKTEIQTIPALRLSLVDQSDLIKVGSEVTYTLQVINQGTGPDTNLTLKLVLPPGLEYVSSEGSTVAKAEGQVVAFGNVETLEAGKTVTWNIKARAKSVADVRTTAELNSAYLKVPITTTEPTRLIQ